MQTPIGLTNKVALKDSILFKKHSDGFKLKKKYSSLYSNPFFTEDYSINLNETYIESLYLPLEAFERYLFLFYHFGSYAYNSWDDMVGFNND